MQQGPQHVVVLERQVSEVGLVGSTWNLLCLRSGAPCPFCRDIAPSRC